MDHAMSFSQYQVFVGPVYLMAFIVLMHPILLLCLIFGSGGSVARNKFWWSLLSLSEYASEKNKEQKTWKGKMVRKFRRNLSGSSAADVTEVSEGPTGTFGVPLELCPASSFSEVCILISVTSLGIHRFVSAVCAPSRRNLHDHCWSAWTWESRNIPRPWQHRLCYYAAEWARSSETLGFGKHSMVVI
jgi:hypothetical protein